VNADRWYSTICGDCGRRLLVPELAARRIADGVSFVLCIPCGEVYEARTGHQPVAQLPARMAS
jgi:RNase P subunit RPR2